MHKIRKGDQVVVTTGREKGKRGSVLRVYESGKVLVEGVNRVKKHQRPNPVKGQTGGIVDKEAPMAISNVMLVNPATGKGDRVGFKFLEAQGGQPPRKVRFFKSNGEVVDV
jgi:large subunit ribosomal protein L24